MARRSSPDAGTELSTSSSITEYFHDVLTQALRNQGVTPQPSTEHYLVNLLEAYSHAQVDDRALALSLADAVAASLPERVAIMRELADRALFISGFFPDSIPGTRGLVDVDYYIAMGENAYATLARIARGPRDSAYAPVFGELSERFPRFVDVLNEVSAGSRLRTDRDLVRLYERWLRTGSQWVARQLEALGVSMRGTRSRALS